MKKILFVFMALVCTATLMAQRIAVVDANGSTQIFKTLPEAIKGAADNSVIYLPGGGFSIADSVKITKKLTIIGIGHKSKNENVDGITTISGNLFFNDGSSGSSVIGCYITGKVSIGNNATVNDILIRYCNLYSVVVTNNHCYGTIVNQNYIRNTSEFNYSAVEFTNNICYRIAEEDGGIISNNIISVSSSGSSSTYSPLYNTRNSFVIGNIFMNQYHSPSVGTSNNSYTGNMGWTTLGDDEDYIYMSGIAKDSVFVKNAGVSPASNFHFKDEYKQYENRVGIYAGSGFNDDQIAPVPFIVAKSIDQQTDASGHLNVKIRVKAGGTE